MENQTKPQAEVVENTEATEAPNLTPAQAAQAIVQANSISLVKELAEILPYRLSPKGCAGGHFHLNFYEDGNMELEAEALGIDKINEDMHPSRIDMMFIIGLFLIQQGEAAIRSVQAEHLTEQLEELVKSGALNLGSEISPELVQMLASTQNQATDVTDQMVADQDKKVH